MFLLSLRIFLNHTWSAFYDELFLHSGFMLVYFANFSSSFKSSIVRHCFTPQSALSCLLLADSEGGQQHAVRSLTGCLSTCYKLWYLVVTTRDGQHPSTNLKIPHPSINEMFSDISSGSLRSEFKFHQAPLCLSSFLGWYVKYQWNTRVSVIDFLRVIIIIMEMSWQNH